MTVKRLGTILCGIAAFVLSGCVPTSSGEAVTLDADDNGSTVTIPVSGSFTVSLASNPTTGYEWGLVDLTTSILENTDHQYVQDAAPPGMVGVGGTETWEFTGRSAGTTTLRLEYRRPWETEEEVESFEVTVTITAEG